MIKNIFKRAFTIKRTKKKFIRTGSTINLPANPSQGTIYVFWVEEKDGVTFYCSAVQDDEGGLMDIKKSAERPRIT